MVRILRNALVLFVLVQLGALSAGRAQTSPAPAAPTGPRAHFAQPSVNFGKVMPNAPQRHDFIVTNAGTAVLIISDVAPGCGCTTAGKWDREIAPGKTGRIPIVFDPANFSGAVSKSVVVTSNDPARPAQILDIQATVWRPLDVDPAITTFLPVETEPRLETKIVRIVNNVDEPVTLEPAQSTNPQFTTELKTIRPGREFALHITYDARIPDPSHNATLTLKTSLSEQPVLSLTAFAMPQPAVVTIPPVIQLPPGPRDPNYTYNIVIRNNGSAALKVTDPSASVPGIAVRLIEPQPGKLFYVSVAIPGEFKATADQPAVISVKTSHPKFPEIRVPIVPAAPPASAAAVTAAAH